MLRSIFTLIQRILDHSEKQYNNTKSRAVIYCLTNHDNLRNIDLEMDSTRIARQNTLENNEKQELPCSSQTYVKTDQGDILSCKQDSKTNSKVDCEKKSERITSFVNEDATVGKQTDEAMVDQEVGPNIHDVLAAYPKKKFVISQSETDQMSTLLEQITKMKTGLQRLQEIAHQFKNSSSFIDDLNYLKENVNTAIVSPRKCSSDDTKHLSSKL